jgi:hypothetical protein
MEGEREEGEREEERRERKNEKEPGIKKSSGGRGFPSLRSSFFRGLWFSRKVCTLKGEEPRARCRWR